MRADVEQYYDDEPIGWLVTIDLKGVSESYAEEIRRGVQSYLDLIQDLEHDDNS